MAAVLSLSPASPRDQNDEILDFIAIFCSNEKQPDVLQNLSPKTMLWGDNLWLIDMRACSDFWRHSAQQRDTAVSLYVQQQISDIFAGDVYYGAAAFTPWEALLLAKAAREKGFAGLIHFSSRLGRNLLRGLSWDLWWESCGEYAQRKKSLTHF